MQTAKKKRNCKFHKKRKRGDGINNVDSLIEKELVKLRFKKTSRKLNNQRIGFLFDHLQSMKTTAL